MVMILWKWQYFFGSLRFEDKLNGLGHFKAGSSFIRIRILSIGISKGVNFFLDDASRLLLLALVSEELSLWSLFLLCKSIFSYFFRLVTNPFAINVSSPFIYFWALNSRSVIEVGGVFPQEKMKSGLFNLAWKFIIITWSSASSISNTALFKHFTYSFRVSLSFCFKISRYEVGLLCHWPPIKCQTKESLNCSKFAIDDADSLLNDTLVAPLRVAGKDLQITSSKVCWRFNIVLNALMWSRGSLVLS